MINRTSLFSCFLLTVTILSSSLSQLSASFASQENPIDSKYSVSQLDSSAQKNSAIQNKAVQKLKATVKQNEAQNSVLLEAVENQNIEGVKAALAKGADANASNPAAISALMLAASNGNLDIFNTLLDAGANVNAESGEGETALMYAADGGHLKIAQILIEQGADINVQDAGDFGGTALIRAVAGRQIEMVRLLLANGADISIKTLYGDTALTLAQKYGYPEIAELLEKVEP